ncbi:hypothetical protein BC830DRAFT_1085582 [Chytriomyces sp. MP71]|nr:hypothetical protein BC830DRAFT_1085582 [Chytriomyces sp. MP71]
MNGCLLSFDIGVSKYKIMNGFMTSFTIVVVIVGLSSGFVVGVEAPRSGILTTLTVRYILEAESLGIRESEMEDRKSRISARPSTSIALKATAAAAMETGTQIYGYNASNVLTNFFRGLQMGIAALLLLLILFVHHLFPKLTIATALIIALVTLATEPLGLLYDTLLLPDCYFRVKIVYAALYLEIIMYSIFLGDLTYKVSQSYSKIIPGTFYIILFALCGRTASSFFVVFSYTWKRGANQICSSVLNPQINLIDKLVELCFSLIMSVLFLYPVILGYRDISEHTCNSVSNGAAEVGRNWLRQIIRDQGFLSVVTCVVQVVYVVCIFTGGDPSLVSLWNSIFTGDYVIFMAIHLIATVVRKVGAPQVGLRKVLKDSSASSKAPLPV